MQNAGTNYCDPNIRKDTGRIPEAMGNVSKNYLIHPVVRTNVKHIDLSKRVEQIVTSCGNQTADKVKSCGVQISTERKIRRVRTVGENQLAF